MPHGALLGFGNFGNSGDFGDLLAFVSFVVENCFCVIRTSVKAVTQVNLRLVLRNCRVIEGLEFE